MPVINIKTLSQDDKMFLLRDGVLADIVLIDRKSPWGNPFRIGKDGDREEVIEKYRHWLWERCQNGKVNISELKALKGKRLACWCHPLPCHGDVLLRAIDWAHK